MIAKISSFATSGLERLVTFCGSFCLVCSSAHAVGYGVNLIKNGNAEAGAFSSTGAPVKVPEWTTSSAFTVVNYGAPGGFPTENDPGPPDRQNQFFAGGNAAATSTATQTIDVSPNASAIDTGKALVDLSGWFGGFENDGDMASFQVAFFNGNTRLGGDLIGPVDATDRNGATKLLQRAKTIPVPANTRRFAVTLTMNKDAGGAFNDGYADSLSLVLRVPVVVTSAEDAGPGTLRSAMKTGSVISFSRKVFGPADAPHVIALDSSLPILRTSAVINGPGADVLTIKRSTAPNTSDFQVFTIGKFTREKIPGPVVTISGLTIANGAGGILVLESSLVLNDCALVGNSSSDYGGALLSQITELQVNRCLFAGNSQAYGAGGASIQGGNASLTNCTFSGNMSDPGVTAEGGGLGVRSFSSVGAVSVTLHNCTFAGNSSAIGADQSGAACEVNLDNTIVTKSTTGVNFTTKGYADVFSKGFNLSDLPDGAYLNQPGDRNSTEAKLGQLQDHGGPTMTHALLPGSPAIDKGDSGLKVDQRGFGRPNNDPKSAKGGGNNSDIGAFEFAPPRRFETEKLAVIAKTPAAEHKVIQDPNLSGGAGTLLSNTTVSSFVTYKVPIPGAGIYDVKVRVKTGANRGTFQLAIEGVNIGAPQDEYSPTVKYQVHDLGRVSFGSGGPTSFTFTVKGKNANSAGTTLAFDSIQLTAP